VAQNSALACLLVDADMTGQAGTKIYSMKHYELLTVIPGTLGEDEVPGVVDQIKKILADHEATLDGVIEMGKTRLTYPMKHIRYGYFHTMSFQAEPEKVADIKKQLGLMNVLLRALINTRTPEQKKEYAGKIDAFRARRDKYSKQKQQKEQTSQTAARGPASPQPVATDTVKKEDATKEGGKVDLKDIDKKLDALLEGDLEKV